MTCYEGESLVGLIPLMLDARTRTVNFIGHPLTDRNGAVAVAGRLRDVWASVITALRRSSTCTHAVLPELLDEDVRACETAAHGATVRTPALPSPVIDLPRQWEDHAARLSNSRRAGWRRDLRALDKLGEIRFVSRSGTNLSDDDLAAFHHDRVGRWRYAGKLHQLSALERGDDFPRFLSILARSLGADGMFHLSELNVGGLRAAQNLYLCWDDVVLDYMRAFNPAVRAHSPGNLATLAGTGDVRAQVGQQRIRAEQTGQRLSRGGILGEGQELRIVVD